MLLPACRSPPQEVQGSQLCCCRNALFTQGHEKWDGDKQIPQPPNWDNTPRFFTFPVPFVGSGKARGSSGTTGALCDVSSLIPRGSHET